MKKQSINHRHNVKVLDWKELAEGAVMADRLSALRAAAFMLAIAIKFSPSGGKMGMPVPGNTSKEMRVTQDILTPICNSQGIAFSDVAAYYIYFLPLYEGLSVSILTEKEDHTFILTFDREIIVDLMETAILTVFEITRPSPENVNKVSKLTDTLLMSVVRIPLTSDKKD